MGDTREGLHRYYYEDIRTGSKNAIVQTLFIHMVDMAEDWKDGPDMVFDVLCRAANE